MNLRIAAMLVLSVGVGCASTDADRDATRHTALPQISESDALGAPRCNAAMLDNAVFGIFVGEPEKLAALDRQMRSVRCVDAFESIESMLSANPKRADRLWLRYEASLQQVGASLAEYW